MVVGIRKVRRQHETDKRKSRQWTRLPLDQLRLNMQTVKEAISVSPQIWKGNPTNPGKTIHHFFVESFIEFMNLALHDRDICSFKKYTFRLEVSKWVKVKSVMAFR
jgi:hypothetical protein